MVNTRRDIAILEAPSTLGLTSDGVETLPAALLAQGLQQRLGAAHAGRIEVPDRSLSRDRSTGILNPAALVRFSTALADALEPLLDEARFPLVLGGDCTILLGDLLALRRRGRFGLLFVDGHADFYQPEAEPNGDGASMDLAFATGRGPSVVTNIEGRRPLVRDEDVVLFGRRDAEEAGKYGSQRVEDTGIDVIDLQHIRRHGIDQAITEALGRLTKQELAGFWLHIDVDVLDDAIMPAVDYRMTDGLSWAELQRIIAAARATGRCCGMNVAIFNPTLDPEGVIAAGLVDTLTAALVHG